MGDLLLAVGERDDVLDLGAPQGLGDGAIRLDMVCFIYVVSGVSVLLVVYGMIVDWFSQLWFSCYVYVMLLSNPPRARSRRRAAAGGPRSRGTAASTGT